MTEERGSLRPLLDAVTGLLSDPAVIEGLVAGISAISASRRAKSSGGGEQASGGLLDMLPGVLPLLSLISPQESKEPGARQEAAQVFSDADADSVADADGGEAADVDASGVSYGEGEEGGSGNAEEGGNDDGDAVQTSSGNLHAEVSDISREAQRENLLLALRPFLSESRRAAADAMVQVNKLSGLFGQVRRN